MIINAENIMKMVLIQNTEIILNIEKKKIQKNVVVKLLLNNMNME